MLRYEVKDIYEFSEEELKRCFYAMSELRKSKIITFKDDSLKRRTLAAECLARTLLAEESGMPPDYFEILPNKNGKLYISNYDGLYFNLSHSGDFVAVAVAKVEVGVDLEVIRPILPKIAKKICNENELQYIFGHMPCENEFNKECDGEIAVRFFEIWTAKEAYIKCTGEGIRNPINLKAVDTSFAKFKEIKDNYVLHIVKKSDIM